MSVTGGQDSGPATICKLRALSTFLTGMQQIRGALKADLPGVPECASLAARLVGAASLRATSRRAMASLPASTCLTARRYV